MAVNVLDYDIIISKLELQMLYYIRFQTNALGKDMKNWSSQL